MDKHILKVLLFSVCIGVMISGCFNRKNQQYNLEINQNYVDYNDNYEYIHNNNRIHIYNKTFNTFTTIKEDNILCVSNVENVLYYVCRTKDEYLIKREDDNNVEIIYHIPLQNIDWCIICQKKLYVYTDESLYVIDLECKSSELIADKVNAQFLSVNDNSIYYSENVVNMIVDDSGFIDNITEAYLGQRINKINIETRKVSNIFSKIEKGNIYYVTQVLACYNGVLFYISEDNSYTKNIIFIDNDSNIRLLKSNITTDIDYLATDEKFVYYTDSKEKKIFSINIENNKSSEILNYQNYDIKDVLGITSNNIYLKDIRENILQYNIFTKTITVL